MKKPKNKRAFTLVELLMVISGISVLISIMLPALSHAKEEALKTACMANMRTIGLAINSYAADYKDSIPSNCHNADQSNAAGPYRMCGGVQIQSWAATYEGSALRFDKAAVGASDNWCWTGLGLTWALDYIPFNLNAARALWCPAERVGSFDKYVAGWNPGPGYLWSWLSTHRWVAMGDFATPALGGYTYRSIAAITPSATFKAGSMRISSVAPYVASTDRCMNLFGEGIAAWGTTGRVASHYPGYYRGLNRLWYDGHVKWMNDPNCAWRTYVPGGNTNWGNFYGNTWLVYDAAP